MSDNRTERPTPKRLREARLRGQVAQSRDLSCAVVTLGALAVLFFFTRSFAAALAEFTRTLWSDGVQIQLSADGFASLVTGAALPFLSPFLWLAAIAFVIPAILAVAQRGWIFLPDRLLPDFTRLAPGQGVGRMFSLDGLYRFVSGLAKMGVVVFPLVRLIRTRMAYNAPPVGSVVELAARLSEVLFGLAFQITLGFCLLAVLDLGYQRWKYYRDLRMTPQEIREEHREDSGRQGRLPSCAPAQKP